MIWRTSLKAGPFSPTPPSSGGNAAARRLVSCSLFISLAGKLPSSSWVGAREKAVSATSCAARRSPGLTVGADGNRTTLAKGSCLGERNIGSPTQAETDQHDAGGL